MSFNYLPILNGKNLLTQEHDFFKEVEGKSKFKKPLQVDFAHASK